MRILQWIAVLLMVIGLIWMGQGSGYFPYPASSFMIDQTPWIFYGAGLLAVGAILFFVARRLRR